MFNAVSCVRVWPIGTGSSVTPNYTHICYFTKLVRKTVGGRNS